MIVCVSDTLNGIPVRFTLSILDLQQYQNGFWQQALTYGRVALPYLNNFAK